MGTTDQQTVIELRSGTLELQANGVVRVTPNLDAQDLAGMRESVDAIRDVRERLGHKVRLIVDIRGIRSLSREARLELQGPRNMSNLIGGALLSDSGISRVVGNFFVGLNQGAVPIRLFASEDEARTWLEGLPDDNV